MSAEMTPLRTVQRTDKRRSGSNKKHHQSRIDGEDVLDVLSTGTAFLSALSNGAVAVPGLQAAAVMAKEVVAIAQTVRSNKEDCLELAQQVTEYLYAITCTYDESVVHEVGDHFHANVEVLYQEFSAARNCMAKLSSRGKLRRVLQYQRDKRSIEDARRNLTHVFSRFNLANSIMLRQEVRAGFVAVSSSDANLRTDVRRVRFEVRSLRTELRSESQRGLGPDEIGFAQMLAVQKAVHVIQGFFFLMTGDRDIANYSMMHDDSMTSHNR